MKGKRLFLLFFAIVALSSCQALFFEDRAGQPIRFNASMRSNSLTKTMYAGGQTYDTDEGEKERINWTQDDDVSVYLYWELQNGSAPAKADPDAKHGLDYNVTPTRNVNERGYGTLAAKAEKLTWKGSAKENVWFDHYFYSTYPASLSDKYSSLDYKNPQEVEITFNLPAANANEMKYAYMAAAAQSVSTRENEDYTQSVDLDYYPMITTLYVTLINESNKTGNLNVKVSPSASNTKNPLFGSYSAKLNAAGNRFITTDTKEANVTADYSSYNYSFEGKGPKSVPFFIRPRNYAANDVTLTIGDKAYDLDYAFVPCHKYNITVTVKDGDIVTPPTFKETIGPGEAQFLILWISNYLTGDNFNNFMGVNWGSDHDWNAFLNKFVNGGVDWNSSKLGDELVGFFTEAQLNELYNKLLSVKKFETSNKQITQPIHGEFFSLFPQIEEIYIQTYSTVEIPKLQNLKTVTFEYAKEVTISECDNLTSISLRNTPDLEKFTLSSCKSVTTFDMTVPWDTWTPNAEYTFDNMENLSSVKLCSAKAVNVYDCPRLPDANISMKSPVGINRNRP